MADNKTQPKDLKVEDFLSAVEHPTRRADSETLNSLFKEVSGFQPVMWGPSIIGYGRYHYKYESGREGDFLATGFSPRKANLSIYIMPGYQDYGGFLDRLGKHKKGASCLYINKLADIDVDVLAELIEAGLKDLNGFWPVEPT